MAVLPTLLHPTLVNERISQLVVINDAMQKAHGVQAGGANCRQTPARRGSYDVFNRTRDLPLATLPGVERPVVARHPIGTVPFYIPRATEKLPMPLEELNQMRPLGGPANEIDQLGEQYIIEQETNQKMKMTNLREFQIASMYRGSYTWTDVGTSGFSHDFSGGSHTINYQVPAGNKSQLDMLGGGDIIGVSWDNPTAPLVRDLLAVNAALIELVGTGLTDVWCTSVVWGNIATNIEVQNLAGAVNAPHEMIRSETDQTFEGKIPALPWVKFHIIDNGINTGTAQTFAKLIADTAICFSVQMSSDIVNYYEAAEPVVDPVTRSLTNQFGEYYYHTFHDDPVSYEFHSLFNCLPSLKVPKAIGYGTVVF